MFIDDVEIYVFYWYSFFVDCQVGWASGFDCHIVEDCRLEIWVRIWNTHESVDASWRNLDADSARPFELNWKGLRWSIEDEIVIGKNVADNLSVFEIAVWVCLKDGRNYLLVVDESEPERPCSHVGSVSYDIFPFLEVDQRIVKNILDELFSKVQIETFL